MVKIGGLQKSTLIDYPESVACTVFLLGCNFRCPWCYSSEIVLTEKIKEESLVAEKDFFSFLEKRKNDLDGVVVCGGEPTINKDLVDFVKKIKSKKLKVKLDTNGSNPLMLKKLLEENLLDYIAMDIKTQLDKEKYSFVVGTSVDIEKIKESIRLIKESGIDYEFRTTVVPGFHTKEDVIEAARQIAPAKKYYIQNFRPEKNIDSSLIDQRPYSDEFLEEIRQEIKALFEVCGIR